MSLEATYGGASPGVAIFHEIWVENQLEWKLEINSTNLDKGETRWGYSYQRSTSFDDSGGEWLKQI